MDDEQLRGKWALITGASSGLGQDFARELAARGMHLILAARRREPMEQLAAQLGAEHRVEVEVLPTDLLREQARVVLYELASSGGREVAVLVNNAGFGVIGDFLKSPWQRQRDLIEVDVAAVVHLTYLFAPDMVRRRFGRILQVSSTAAFQPVPGLGVYSGAKAFVLSFSHAVHYELRGTGVTCTALCPGTTRTGFFEAAGKHPTAAQLAAMMDSRDVARVGIHAMLQGRAQVVPGRLNNLMIASQRLAPRSLVTRIAARVIRRAH